MQYRIGFGYDVHQLKKNIDLYLGGIKIPYHKGCLAHSDGDVLIHAICDALLGAVNSRDIGFHFPDNQEKYKNINSKLLLKEVISIIKDKGYKVGNIDCTICLQKPKIAEYIPEMKKILAKIIGIQSDEISIKATTTENLGFIGKQKGISAYCVVLIQDI
ncbi:MAG: 2-C-methyl-D-erythritol 2,4-cyclodiphosphate synthase [Bacteroidales bacterium]|nr:2-C-methyl-D-erythritol 2,4-cyclodiphosphate synthase [Bacteroidales bacterium]